MAFHNSAAESAQLYDEYLEEKGRGSIEYRVFDISLDPQSVRKNEYWLKTNQTLKYVDSLQIKINNISYSNEQIKPVVFDELNRRLKVSLSRDTMEAFSHISPNQVVEKKDWQIEKKYVYLHLLKQ